MIALPFVPGGLRNTSSWSVAIWAESILAILVAVAPDRNPPTCVRPAAPEDGSKFEPFAFLRLKADSNESAEPVIDELPLFCHQPLLLALPAPRQMLPKSRFAFAPVASLTVPSQHTEL